MTSEVGKAAKATAALVAATASATTTVTETTNHPGEMITIIVAIGEIEAARADPDVIEEDGARGAMAPPHETHVTAIGI